MGKLLERAALAIFAVVLVAAFGALLLFKLAENRVSARMKPPLLMRAPEPASDLVYRTMDGQEQHLSATRGKVVFLNLWGTWCIPCLAEMPTVERLYEHYKGDPQVQFLIVSRLDSPKRVEGYARHNHFSLPFYVTRDQDIPQAMQFYQYPATFVLAKDGTIVSKHFGAADWSDGSVVKFIDRLRAE